MANHQRLQESGEEEALFHSYPCATYYVQSPSATSHATNSSLDAAAPAAVRSVVDPSLLSPLSSDATTTTTDVVAFNIAPRSREVASRFSILSRYSSSRGSSNNSIFHEKKISYDLRSHDGTLKAIGERFRINADGDEADAGGNQAKRSRVWRLLSLDRSSSIFCFGVQIAWRLMASFGLALLVFFFATKPPAPIVTFKMSRIRDFSLDEGVDTTGVVTKILNCNSSVIMEIDNKSKVFGLHAGPTTLEMAFGRFKFATSESAKLYIENGGSYTTGLHVGAKNLPIYGAGQEMHDLLESKGGLPVALRIATKSSYRVVGGLVSPKYHHRSDCLLVLANRYDEKRRSQIFHGSCSRVVTRHA